MAIFSFVNRSLRPQYFALGNLLRPCSSKKYDSMLAECRIDPARSQRSLSTSSHRFVILDHTSSETKSDTDINPMVVLYGWLLAKSRHLEKFTELYSRHGADVITVQLNVAETLLRTISNEVGSLFCERVVPSPGETDETDCKNSNLFCQVKCNQCGTKTVAVGMRQALRPKKAEETAHRILDTLQSPSNRNKPVLVHGFSIGGYLYSQTLNKMVTDFRFSSVPNRIIGQIFDSPVDFDNIPYGVSNAATSSPFLKHAIRFTIESYFALTRKYTVDQYMARSQLFYNNPVRSPALFLFSDDDSVASPEACERCASLWRDDLGMDVTSKKWDSSPHVSHFYKHQEEYTKILAEFLKKVGMIDEKAHLDKI